MQAKTLIVYIALSVGSASAAAQNVEVIPEAVKADNGTIKPIQMTHPGAESEK